MTSYYLRGNWNANLGDWLAYSSMHMQITNYAWDDVVESNFDWEFIG